MFFKEDFYNLKSYRLQSYHGMNSNRVALWDGTDRESNLSQNLLDYPDNPSLDWYKEHPIEYRLNTEYFRTPHELSNDPGNIFLGCSHTSGTGLPIEYSWGWVLNGLVGGKFYNMGMSGGNMQSAYIIFSHYIDKVNVNNVFCYMPHFYRSTLSYDDKWLLLTPHQLSTKRDEYYKEVEIYQKLSIDERNASILYLSALNALAYECSVRNIPFYFIGADTSEECTNYTEYQHLLPKNYLELQARDLRHHSSYYHFNLAHKFYDLYSNKETYLKSRANLRGSRGDKKAKKSCL